MLRHHHLGGPPPPPHHHEGHPPPPEHWASGAEVQILANQLRKYLSEEDAGWAAEVIAFDPGPGRVHSLLLIAILERVEALMERLNGGKSTKVTPGE